MNPDNFFFRPILLIQPESAPTGDIARFCWLLFRYARRDTASGVKRFHWPSYKQAVEHHTLPSVSYTSFTTARADGPSSTVHDVAAYVTDVLAAQIKQEVDIEWLANTIERTLFNFASAQEELKAFPCIVATVRLEGTVGSDQAAWAALGAGLIKDPAVTVDVMHCHVSKSLTGDLQAAMDSIDPTSVHYIRPPIPVVPRPTSFASHSGSRLERAPSTSGFASRACMCIIS